MTQRMGASEPPYPSPSESPPTTKASEGPHPAARRPARRASAVGYRFVIKGHGWFD